jgi:hypothetical protein
MTHTPPPSDRTPVSANNAAGKVVPLTPFPKLREKDISWLREWLCETEADARSSDRSVGITADEAVADALEWFEANLSALAAAPTSELLISQAAQADALDEPATLPSADTYEAFQLNGRGWAMSRWHDEVKNRPLVNVHRRSLDDTWRQVIRYFSGDPDKLCGPSHDALLNKENSNV